MFGKGRNVQKKASLKSNIHFLVLGAMAGLSVNCSSGKGGNDGAGGESGDSGGNGGLSNVGGFSGNGTGGGTGAGSAGAAGSVQGGAASGGSGGGAGGMSGSGGTPGGAGGAAGATVGGAGGIAASEDKRPWFSFFVTSKEGILSFSENKSELVSVDDNVLSKAQGGGLGGDLGGLAGADDKCMKLAQRANPGDKKVWHAFLSTKAGPVNAIDRVGKGPWYNFKKMLLAKNLADLVPDAQDKGRPTHYGPPDENRPLLEMFTDENGDPASSDTSKIDNHDTLTGSDAQGKYNAARSGTCNDWTSVDGTLQKPMIGHSWPRFPDSGRHWISEHEAGGCARGIDTRKIASNKTDTVGAGGGYGGFYCFAVTGM